MKKFWLFDWYRNLILVWPIAALRNELSASKKGSSALHVTRRRGLRDTIGFATTTSTAFVYTHEQEGGLGLRSFKDVLDGDALERLQRVLLPPEKSTYWEKRIAEKPDASEEDRQELLRKREGARKVHEVTHMMRLEYLEVNGYKSQPDGTLRGVPDTGEPQSPWDGIKVPPEFKHRKAGIIDDILGRREWGIEPGNNTNGSDLWRLMTEDNANDLVSMLRSRGFHGVGDITNPEGNRLVEY